MAVQLLRTSYAPSTQELVTRYIIYLIYIIYNTIDGAYFQGKFGVTAQKVSHRAKKNMAESRYQRKNTVKYEIEHG